MRTITAFILSLTIAFVAIAAPAKVSDADVAFLMASATKDFRLSNKAGALQFRKVHVGRLPLSEGESNPLMCGEFHAAGKAEWTQFATIKTSDYEQWIGGTGGSFCSNPSVTWDEGRDLTADLQKTYDAAK